MPPNPTAMQQMEQAIAAQPQPQPQIMLSQPGIERDGSRFSHHSYIDGQWCRFWLDKPRKMGGYQEQVRDVIGIARNFNVFTSGGFAYVHLGTESNFERYAIDLSTGSNTTLIDRTPSGFVIDPANLWQSDVITEASGGVPQIFAAATPSLQTISSTDSVPVYTGDVLSTDPLVAAVFTIDANAAGVAFAQTLAGPGFMVLNVNAPIPEGAGNITLTTNGDLTAVNATITGTDTSGAPLTVGPVALPNNATLDSGSQFSTISSIAIDAGTGGLTISAGWLAGSQPLTTDGGLCVVGPFLFLYGVGGIIKWSAPGIPLNFATGGAGDARPVADKVVRGMPIRGQSAPALIAWSLSSLIIGQFVGAPTFWNFSTVSVNGSILSPASVIEHNGVYYWATTTGFSSFAGVMQDIPNKYNRQWFRQNLNLVQRNKVFAIKIPQWNEIWWCFPKGDSLEPNHAVILKYDEGFWYDTPLPNGGRGGGYYDVTYSFPIMSGVEPHSDTSGGTSVWQHEIGFDEVSGPVPQAKAIQSFFETHEFNLQADSLGTKGDNRSLSFSAIEPDYNQVGDLTLEVFSRENARQKTFQSPVDDPNYPYVMADDDTDTLTTFKWSGRLTSFVVESNVVGGDYYAGAPLMHLKPTLGRRTL